MKQATMLLSLNNGEPIAYKHPDNVVEARFDDGEINPEYKGTSYVDVICDKDCNCDFEEHVPGICEIEAVLEYPVFPDDSDYYGYLMSS